MQGLRSIHWQNGENDMVPTDAAKSERTSPVPNNMNTVRGLACLLVVALHVIGDAATNGLHLPMTSGWHYAMVCIEFLRMPLFTALSGYLYAGNRVTRQAFGQFWTKKIRRLGLPLIFVTIVVWILRRHINDDATSLSDAFLFGFGHLWYIQALIILFAAISIGDVFFRPRFGALVLASLAAIMTAQANLNVPTFFSFNGALYLAPYFLFGILLREQPAWLQDRRSGQLASGVVLIVLTAQQLGLFGLADGVTVLQLPAALAGMAGVVSLLQLTPRNALLAAIGGYSYTIYLWHIVASSAVRGALLKAGVTSLPIMFGLCFVAAVIAPIVLFHIARRVPLLGVAVTGGSVRDQMRPPGHGGSAFHSRWSWRLQKAAPTASI
jgi:glucan biosynthesis protein C